MFSERCCLCVGMQYNLMCFDACGKHNFFGDDSHDNKVES